MKQIWRVFKQSGHVYYVSYPFIFVCVTHRDRVTIHKSLGAPLQSIPVQELLYKVYQFRSSFKKYTGLGALQRIPVQELLYNVYQFRSSFTTYTVLGADKCFSETPRIIMIVGIKGQVIYLNYPYILSSICQVYLIVTGIWIQFYSIVLYQSL